MRSDCIGFVGAGQMARALARGMVRAGQVAAAIVAHDPAREAAQQFVEEIPGALMVGTNREVLEKSRMIILAVKPQSLAEVAVELAEVPKSDKLMVSILAGVRLSSLCRQLSSPRVVRVMPNTPSLVGCGAAAFALGPGATREDSDQVSRLLGSVGMAFEVEERLLDAVTGLSGSGPAYVYAIIEALSDGGVRVGLPRKIATALAAQTVLGAAQMVLSAAEHPAVLRERVTSPGGTTIAGLQLLERRGLRSALIDAVEAATRRSEELGQA